MRRLRWMPVLLSVAAVSLAGCEGQESAKIHTTSQAPLAAEAAADDADLQAARDELIRGKVQLDAARNRNYELQQHVDDLEQQLTNFDQKGLAAKIAALQYRNAGLAKEVDEMKKQLAGVRDGSLD